MRRHRSTTQQVANRGRTFMDAINTAKRGYQEMMNLSKTPAVKRSYAKFLLEVANNPTDGVDLLVDADAEEVGGPHRALCPFSVLYRRSNHTRLARVLLALHRTKKRRPKSTTPPT